MGCGLGSILNMWHRVTARLIGHRRCCQACPQTVVQLRGSRNFFFFFKPLVITLVLTFPGWFLTCVKKKKGSRTVNFTTTVAAEWGLTHRALLAAAGTFENKEHCCCKWIVCRWMWLRDATRRRKGERRAPSEFPCSTTLAHERRLAADCMHVCVCVCFVFSPNFILNDRQQRFFQTWRKTQTRDPFSLIGYN